MEFKSLKNIESNFRLIRICCALFAGLCAAVAVASVGFSYAFAERQRQKIYVLDGGRSLMVALSQDLSQNRPVEAREHVRRFHELFFTLSPDKAAIESNLNRALLMADRSALSYYKALSEKGFFNRLIAGGISHKPMHPAPPSGKSSICGVRSRNSPHGSMRRRRQLPQIRWSWPSDNINWLRSTSAAEHRTSTPYRPNGDGSACCAPCRTGH